ncbi:MAG: hypothetical protein SO038_07860, partial [Campylobacter sp.]|nr:hypothetical protein [Campylobacter sp.]
GLFNTSKNSFAFCKKLCAMLAQFYSFFSTFIQEIKYSSWLAQLFCYAPIRWRFLVLKPCEAQRTARVRIT